MKRNSKRLAAAFVVSVMGLFISVRHRGADRSHADADEAPGTDAGSWVIARAHSPRDGDDAGRGRGGVETTQCDGIEVAGSVASDLGPVPEALLSIDSFDAVSVVGSADFAGRFRAPVRAPVFRVIAERPGYSMFVSPTFHADDCNPVNLDIRLATEGEGPDQDEQSLARYSELAGRVDGWGTRTASIVLVTAGQPVVLATRDGAFRHRYSGARPSLAYAIDDESVSRPVGLNEISPDVRIGGEDRRPRLLPGRLDLAWRFSIPAGVYFMVAEASVRQLEACVAESVCFSLDDESEGPNVPPCTKDPTSVADCVSHENARRFCQWLGARLPTETEWIQEYTDNGRRRYPWGEKEPDCRLANTLLERRHQLPWSNPMCAGRRTAASCAARGDRTVSGLCDMHGNLGEWLAEPGRAIGVAGAGADGNPFQQMHTQFRGGAIGVRCVLEFPTATGTSN